MAMRMSGLISGMDTESIIQQLVSARQTKVDNTKKAQTKLEWKQETWKSLNTKLKNLQSKYVSNLRFSTSYMKKTTKVSNSSVVSVITGEDAVNGVQQLEVKQLAKTAYLTGDKVEAGADGKSWNALSKISDVLGDDFAEGSISFTAGGKTININVTKDTTISDFLSQVKASGLNANFDAGQQRFFISAKQPGADNNFSMTANNEAGANILSKLGLQVSLKDDASSLTRYQEYAGYYVAGDRDTTLANMQSMIDKDIAAKTDEYLSQYKSLLASKKSAEDKIAEIQEKYKDTTLESSETYQNQLDEKNARIKELTRQIYILPMGDESAKLEEEKAKLQSEVDELTKLKNDADALETQQKNLESYNKQIQDIQDKYIDVTETTDADGNVTYGAVAKDSVKKEIEDSYYNKAAYAAKVMDDYNNGKFAKTGATKIEGRDAKILLNGAEFTSANNTFAINGLTFTALAETKDGEEVTVTTQDDTDGIYNMIKDFLKEYNSIINEIDKLYNAESAKGYEPLTDDEKDAMSDTEIEKYENKIKSALLKSDDTLSNIRSGFINVMSTGVEVNGKTMYLSNFGINTLSYFVAADNEKNMYHIDGDSDDSDTSGNADKLKSMISSDPDTVVSFFTQLSRNLYSKMSDLSTAVDGYRSYGSFYDDKKMTSDYNDYKSKIAEQEQELADYEDKWYEKFSKMETALAKLQSNTNAVTSLLGG
ncbi:MAG: flagellar filament capping protein FliD [Clostridium sp.]|nr:flagellar filament capping protein FliD [Clostridium sp.]